MPPLLTNPFWYYSLPKNPNVHQVVGGYSLSSTTTSSVTITNVTAGNTLVVIETISPNQTNQTPLPPTDTNGTWPTTAALQHLNSDVYTPTIAMYVLSNAAAGTHTISLDNSAKYYYMDWAVLELSPYLYDVGAITATSAQATSLAVSSPTLGSGTDYLLSLVWFSGQGTVTLPHIVTPSGWSNVFESDHNNPIAIAYEAPPGVTTAQTATWSASSGTAPIGALIAAFTSVATITQATTFSAYYDYNTNGGSFPSSLTTGTFNVAAGSLIVAGWLSTSSSAAPTSVTDLAGNTYTATGSISINAGGDAIYTYACLNSVAYTGNTITIVGPAGTEMGIAGVVYASSTQAGFSYDTRASAAFSYGAATPFLTPAITTQTAKPGLLISFMGEYYSSGGETYSWATPDTFILTANPGDPSLLACGGHIFGMSSLSGYQVSVTPSDTNNYFGLIALAFYAN